MQKYAKKMNVQNFLPIFYHFSIDLCQNNNKKIAIR